MANIDRAEGRRLFGRDPDCYHSARLGYPERIFEVLQSRCGLKAGTRAFEIGAGTGIASQKLLQLGASPLVIIEPDPRLAKFLSKNLAAAASGIQIRRATFESVRLTPDWFDLGTSASAFHWLNEKLALRKVARCLRQGGWWAVWWNLFSDGTRSDEFYKVTRLLLSKLDRSPSAASDRRRPFALDVEQRVANLKATNLFENVAAEIISHSAEFDAERVVRLYSTFSPISRLATAQRRRLLDELGEIAEKRFGGKVEIRVCTPLYTARRR